MRIRAQSRTLATAVSAAASLAGVEGRRRLFAAFEAVSISATEDGVATIVSSVGDFSLRTTIPATIIAPGALALPGGRFAGLVGAFPAGEEVEISASESMGAVACGRSKYRFASIPVADLPSPLAIVKETGRITLERDDAVRLFTAPAFAIGTEATRYYLCGLLVHDDGRDLVAVATDGFRLAKVTVPDMAGLSSDRNLIVPGHAVEVIRKLIGNVETVILSRSQTLFRVEAGPYVFTSKRIDGTFPLYEKVIPSSSDAFVTVDRRELAQALERLKAATAGDKATPSAGLQWASGASELHVASPAHPILPTT